MDLRQSSSKRSKHSSRRRAPKVEIWTLIFFCRIALLALVGLAPWWQGGANWSIQFWLAWGAFGCGLLLAMEYLRAFLKKQSSGKLRMPVASGVFLAVAAFAYLQSLPAFGLNGSGFLTPNTVAIQRWFLGEENAKIAKRIGAIDSGTETAVPGPDPIASASSDSPAIRLGLSIEPLHTRAAIPSLAMIAVVIWIGSVGFANPRWHLVALILLTGLGLLVGLSGLAQVLSWNQTDTNIFGLSKDRSFSAFVSRNSAGAFLNIGLAASMGLASWAFARPRQKDQRYAYAPESPAFRFMTVIEDALSQLTTAQVASVIATSLLFACTIVSNSRGAAVSGAASCIVVLLLGRFVAQGAGRWLYAAAILLMGIGLIYFFELDSRFSQRISQLADPSFIESDAKQGRLYIWGVALNAASFYWLTGSGLGTFHFAHLPFQHPSAGGWYYHSENLFLDIICDMGIVGLVAIVVVIYLFVKSLITLSSPVPGSRTKSLEVKLLFAPIYVAGAALLVSQSIHSFVDFSLVLPALYLPCALVFGMVLGATRERLRMNESMAYTTTSYTASSGTTSRRITVGSSSESKSKGSRQERTSSSLATTSQVAVESTQPKSVGWGSVAVGLVGVFFFLMSGLIPLDALSRTKAMSDWLRDNDQEDLAYRVGSPSDFLAGKWGDPWISIYRVPDALRMISESLIYEFQLVKFEELQSEFGQQRKVALEESKPIMVRLGLSEKVAEIKQENQSATMQRVAMETYIGGEKQLRRWTKALSLVRQAQLSSPLDWELMWARLLLDYDIEIGRWNGWMERTRILGQHVPQKLFQLAVLTRRAGKDREKSEELWQQVMKMSPSRFTAVASVIATDTADEDIDLDSFPQQPAVMRSLHVNPFTADKFPITYERLWERLGKLAEAMPLDHPHRAFWMAKTAEYYGDTEKELEFLEEVVRRNPLQKEARLEWVNKLTAAGEFDLAQTQAEYCLTLSPDDPATQAALEQIKQRRISERERRLEAP